MLRSVNSYPFIIKTVTTGVNLDNYQFGELAFFHYCSGGFCATGRWFTSSLTRVRDVDIRKESYANVVLSCG